MKKIEVERRIRKDGENVREKIQAYPVEIAQTISLATYQHEDNHQWYVVETSTGMGFGGQGNTMKKAVRKAREIISEKGIPFLLREIKKALIIDEVKTLKIKAQKIYYNYRVLLVANHIRYGKTIVFTDTKKSPEVKAASDADFRDMVKEMMLEEQ